MSIKKSRGESRAKRKRRDNERDNRNNNDNNNNKPNKYWQEEKKIVYWRCLERDENYLRELDISPEQESVNLRCSGVKPRKSVKMIPTVIENTNFNNNLTKRIMWDTLSQRFELLLITL